MEKLKNILKTILVILFIYGMVKFYMYDVERAAMFNLGIVGIVSFIWILSERVKYIEKKDDEYKKTIVVAERLTDYWKRTGKIDEFTKEHWDLMVDRLGKELKYMKISEYIKESDSENYDQSFKRCKGCGCEKNKMTDEERKLREQSLAPSSRK